MGQKVLDFIIMKLLKICEKKKEKQKKNERKDIMIRK